MNDYTVEVHFALRLGDRDQDALRRFVVAFVAELRKSYSHVDLGTTSGRGVENLQILLEDDAVSLPEALKDIQVRVRLAANSAAASSLMQAGVDADQWPSWLQPTGLRVDRGVAV